MQIISPYLISSLFPVFSLRVLTKVSLLEQIESGSVSWLPPMIKLYTDGVSVGRRLSLWVESSRYIVSVLDRNRRRFPDLHEVFHITPHVPLL